MRAVIAIAALVIGAGLLGAGVTGLALSGSVTVKGVQNDITCYSGNERVILDGTSGPVRINSRGHLTYTGENGQLVIITTPCMVRVTGPK